MQQPPVHSGHCLRQLHLYYGPSCTNPVQNDLLQAARVAQNTGLVGAAVDSFDPLYVNVLTNYPSRVGISLHH